MVEIKYPAVMLTLQREEGQSAGKLGRKWGPIHRFPLLDPKLVWSEGGVPIDWTDG